MLVLLILILQADPIPTVGDTVWVTRTVRLPAGTSVRPRPVEPSDMLDPLGTPEVILRDGSVLLRYPLVFWQPGAHRVRIPGPILVRPDGWSDTLRATQARITIGSVLPDAPRDSIEPKPAAGSVDRGNRSPQPAVVLLMVVAVLALPARLWWNRRGPASLTTPAPPTLATPERLQGWLDVGEGRAVLDGWRDLLEGLPHGDRRDDLLGRLEEARYGDAAEDDLQTLCSEAQVFYETSEGPR